MQRCTPALAAALLVYALQGCSDRGSRDAPQPARAVPYATFEGVGNLVDGTLTITAVASQSAAALTEIPGRRPGTHAPDTVEVVTDPATVREVPSGCATMGDFEGQVSVRSYYTGATLHDVYAEITSLTPSGYEACNSDVPAFGLQAGLGLWSYGTVPAGGSVPRIWKFRLPSNTVTFYFKGRIMASGAPPHCPGGVALAGPPARYLPSTSISSPPALATGDLDGDGVTDAVIAGRGGSTVVVLRGGGDGTLLPPTAYTVGSDPRGVALGDLNQDGHLDIVTANLGDSSISFLLGNGDGTFGPASSRSTGASTSATVAVGDLNGDAYPEIVVGLGNAIGVFPNADGVIGSLATTAASGGPNALVVSDLDGNGRGDIAYLGSYRTVSVMLNDGAGRFPSRVEYPIPPVPGGDVNPLALAVADLDGDARPELIATNGSQSGSNPTLIAVYPNDGSGAFGLAVTYAVSGLAHAVAAGDLDGNGSTDVVVSTSDRDGVSVFLNDGGGALGPEAVYPALPNPVALAVGSFTAPSGNDLLAVTGGMAMVLPNLGAGVFPTRPAVQTGTIVDSTPVAVAMADLDGDLRQDAIVLNSGYPSDNTMEVHLGRGDGTFADPTIYARPTSGRAVTTGDVDRDGHMDVVVAGGSHVDVYRGSAGGVLSGPLSYAISGSGYDVALADLNRDGWLDLVVADWGAARIQVFVNQGDGTFPATPASYSTFTGLGPTALAVADFNRDGAVDVVAATGSASLVLFRNTGTGPLVWQGSVLLNRSPVGIVAIDVENDGWPDLAIADYDTGTRGLGILPNGKTTATITFGTGVSYGLPFGALKGIAAGDLDGDGFVDIVAAVSPGYAGVYFNTGTGAFSPMVPYPITLPAALDIALSDLNGDFRPDVVELEGTVMVGRHRLVSALSSCLP